MRSGFVVVSFVSHALVVVLAALQPTNGRQTSVSPPIEPRPSGLWAVDLTSPTPAPGAEPELPAPPEAAAEPPVPPAPPEVATEPPVPPASPAPAAEPPARRPASDSRAAQASAVAPSPAKRPAPAPERAAAEEEEASSNSDDWMSVEQQLPNAPASSDPPDTQAAQSAPASDALVERLLAKERDRRHVLQREEQQRRAARARNAVATRRLPTSGAEHQQAPAPVAGQSHAEADVWVELTRWLPRAASGDRAWDRLAPSTQVVFEVELTTEDGKLTGLSARDRSLPAHVRRLLVGIEHLMGRGRFQSAQRAKHAFEISIHLSDTPTRELRIAHTVPNPPAPGRGTFTLPSGRRFDAYVRAINQH